MSTPSVQHFANMQTVHIIKSEEPADHAKSASHVMINDTIMAIAITSIQWHLGIAACAFIGTAIMQNRCYVNSVHNSSVEKTMTVYTHCTSQ
jgi:hypothetical protein